MVDIYSFWIEEFGVDGFRIDTTKHVNMEFWQVFGPTILARRRGRGHRRLLRLRRGVRPAVRLAVHERVLHRGPAAVDDRLRLPARGAGLRRRRARPPTTCATFFETDDYYTDADSNAYAHADVPREPRHGAHRLLPPARRPGRRERRRAARALEARARADVLRPRPAGRLLRRRAGLHRRRRRQGRPRGHVRQRGRRLRRQRPHRHRRDDRPTTTSTATTRCTRRSDQLRARSTSQHPALRSGAQIHRYSSDGPGIYAFSRIDRDERIEYVVALNNSEAAATAAVPTYSARARGTSSSPASGTEAGVPAKAHDRRRRLAARHAFRRSGS